MKFIAEGDLGQLAKRLMMLGFDCSYDGGMSLIDLFQAAALEERILLTRKPLAETMKIKIFRVTADDPNQQLAELAGIYPLFERAEPFCRCLVCNVHLEELKYSTAAEQEKDRRDGPEVPESVIERGLPLYYCPNCRRIYWHGSHIERMKTQLAKAGFEIKNHK